MASIWDRLESLADRPLTSVERAIIPGFVAFTATAGALAFRQGSSLLQVLGISTLAGLAVFAFSLVLLRGPRAKKGKVGVLVALAPETDHLEARIRNDFVQHLRRLVDAAGADSRIDLVHLSTRASREIVDDEGAKAALQRTRCQIAIYGAARTRTVGGVEKHVVTPRMVVSHVPVSLESSKRFGVTLGEVFPNEFVIGVDGDFLGFAFASKLVLTGAKYAIGVTVAFAGEYEHAEQLLLQVKGDVAELPKNQPPAPTLEREVAARLVEIYGIRGWKAFSKWNMTRDKSALAEAEVFYDRLLAIRPRAEGGLLGKAICAFVLHRDMHTVKACIRKCQTSKTATWHYSDAFICLWEGRLDRARAAYRTAARLPTNEDSDYLQSEQFLLEVVAEEPDKLELWFGIGALNLLVKEDFNAAQEAFARFRQLDSTNKYQKYHVWADSAVSAGRARSIQP